MSESTVNLAGVTVNESGFTEDNPPGVLYTNDSPNPGEPIISALARGDKTQTGLEDSDNNLDDTISEPASEYATLYPYNNVTQTESGHFFEMDDTPDVERVRLQHRMGTFFEIQSDGTRIHKVVSNNYEVIFGDNNVHIKGTCNVFIDGDSNLTVGGNVTADIKGDVKATVGGSVTADISGDVSATVGGGVTASVSGDLSASVGGSGKVSTGGSLDISSGGSCNITAGGAMALKAPSISLN